MTQSVPSSAAPDQRIPSKRWRYVIPVAAVMYMLAYLDRNNVAMILPFVGEDPTMHLDKADQGLVTGIFFVGYMVLQIPAAVLADRWSAKKTVTILMILWGFAAMACAVVQGRGQFLLARLILGVFEGGVWPAVLVLLASWFPLRERARANALWMICLPLSNMLMSPLSGFLLEHFSWRTVLFIEGVPPLLWAIVWWFAVADHPKTAKWISQQERAYVEDSLAADAAAKPIISGRSSYTRAIVNPRVITMIIIYFCWMSGFYGFSLWLPTVIGDLTGGSASTVGLLTMIPFLFALVAMLAVSAWSDRTRNRRLAVAIPMLVAVVAMVSGQLVHSPVINVVLLCIVAMGVYAPYGPYWAMPAEYLSPVVLAFAMGLINALGNLGGFLGPYLVGWLTDTTGSDRTGYFVLAGLLVVSALLTLMAVRAPRPVPQTPTKPLSTEM